MGIEGYRMVVVGLGTVRHRWVTGGHLGGVPHGCKRCRQERLSAERCRGVAGGR